jgi:YidC/Oxa1 family membrane protein insertase
VSQLILTQYSGKILGPIAKLLGYLMNGIYLFLDKVFHVQNIGLCIILFTLIIYLCMLPLTVKQQRFSKLNQIMAPELKKIQDKYKNKKDSNSQMAMQEETQALYDKYGVSPTGSCIQMIIQIPILWSLYRVIYNVPAYVPTVKAQFNNIVSGITNVSGYQDTLNGMMDTLKLRNVSLDFTDDTTTANSIIDFVYRLPSTGWTSLKEKFSGITDVIDSTYASVQSFNTMLGINISESPLNLIKANFSDHHFGIVILAVLIPIIAAGIQLVNIKVTQTNNMSGNDAMANQMKTMNLMMPIFSLIMVFSLPVGVGIYWIAGGLIRTIQQLLINVHLNNIDFDKIVEKNKEKAAAKAKKRKEKRGIYENQIRNSASMKTRNIDASKVRENSSTYVENARKGSLASKANMVRDFNNKNNKN